MKKIFVIILIFILLLNPNVVLATNTHSLSLNGSSQYAYDGNIMDNLSTFSVEFWVKATWSANYLGLVNKILTTQGYNGWSIYTTAAGKVQVGIVGSLPTYIYRTGSAIVNDGEWHHIAFTRNGNAYTGLHIYTDGSLADGAGGANGVLSSQSNAYNVNIGADSTPAYYFTGLIDEVRLWNDVRTAQEISDNYDKELVGNEAGLVAYYKLNNSAFDETVNDNDLTLVNSPTYSTDVPFVGVAEDTCTYSGSGDWYIFYSDNCNIKTETSVNGGCYFVNDGAGWFGMEEDINCDFTETGYGFAIEKKYGAEINLGY